MNILIGTPIHINNKPIDAVRFLLSAYDRESMVDKVSTALLTAILIRNQIPMYQGEINPAWKFWDNVIAIIDSDFSHEQQEEFLKEIVELTNKEL